MADRAASNYIIVGVAVILAAAGYYMAQTGIDRHRSRLPIVAYIDCLERARNIDWSKYGMGEDHPSARSAKSSNPEAVC